MTLDHNQWAELMQQLPALTAADGEWRLTARHWTGSLRLEADDDAWVATIDDGVVTGIGSAAPAPAPTPDIEPGHVTVGAPLATWAGMLAADPEPFFHDPWAAVFQGLQWTGHPETQAQTAAAVRRLVELLRAAANPQRDWSPGDRAESARAAAAARFDRTVGRYVHLELDGDDHRVYFEEAGRADGVPLLLQHTAGADGRQWRHILEDEELGRRFRMIAYDLPYHGKSVPPTGKAWWTEEYRLTKAFLMSVPVALADALELDRPVFMGSSIGGHLAVDLAFHHPDRFRAVIGIEAAMKQQEADLTLLWHPRVSNEYKAMMMYGLTSPTSPEALRRETAFVYSQGAPPTFKGDLYYWQTDHDLSRDARHIDINRCAVHLLTGEYDWATPPALSEALAAEIPGATFEVMRGLGHFPMSEDPQRFLEYVRPVLEKIQ